MLLLCCASVTFHQRRRQDFSSNRARGGPDTKVVGHNKTVKNQTYGITRVFQMNFALGYLAGAHLRFYLLVFKSDPRDECEYTL